MSKWTAMAAQTKTAGGAATPEPLQIAKADGLTIADFLATVLPDQGHYCLFLLPEARHVWTDSLGGLAELVEHYKDRQGVYFATESFKTEARSQINVLALKALRLDLDAGQKKHAKDPQGTYATQHDARQALQRFSTATGLVPSLVVSSGEGLHVYYVLNASCALSEWQPAAEALKRFCSVHGLRADPSVTADGARILRPVATLHPNGQRVTVLEATGKVYTLAEFAKQVGASQDNVDSLTAPSRAYDPSINADVLQQHDATPADFELIRAECAAVRWAAEPVNQPNVAEPFWRDVLGVVKFCTGSEGLAQEVSKHHPDHDHTNTARKMAAWGAGATTCAEFSTHSSACTGCKHWGKVKSPIVLGKPNQQTSQDAPTAGLASAVASGALHPIMDQDGGLNYVETYLKDGRTCRQVVRAGTSGANDLILTTAAATGGKAPSQQAIAMFEAQLRTKAKRAGEVTPVALRVAQDGDTRYVYLGPGRVVRIMPQGWEQVDESEGVPLFRWGAGAGELPGPIPFDGDARAALAHCVGHYSELFQTPPDQAAIRTALLVDRLDPETAHPVVNNYGTAGSGKSTAGEHDGGVIDPPSKQGLRTCGGKTEDIAAAAQQQYVLAMDNVSRLDKATSDTLCMVSTGGTLTVRKLYEQSETEALHLLRPLVITSVNPVCTQPDLQTRTLSFEFRPTPNREVISEGELRAMTAARLPAFLGALYSLKAATLRILPEVRQRKGWKHRLITFDQTGEAMLCAAGYPPGAFLKIVGALRESMARRSASGDVFLLKVCAALKVVQSWPKDDTEPTIHKVMNRPRAAAVFGSGDALCAVMRPGILLGLLPRSNPWDRDPPMPKTERALLDALRRLQPTLQAVGILYREGNHGTRPVLRFEWRPADLDDMEGSA